MKNIYFFLFIFHISYFIFLFAFQANALDPIIINKSEKAYPPSFGSDQDYVPSNPSEVDTTTYTKIFDISQNFNAVCSTVDEESGACTAYTSQTIDNVEEKVDLSKFTNHGFRNIWGHLTSYLKNLNASPDERMTAYKNYDLNNPQGTGNFTNRGLSYRDWLCALSRKIDQVALFIDGGNSTAIDEEIGNTKVRFSKVILALNGVSPATRQKTIGAKYFYYPNCQANTQAINLPENIAGLFASTPGSLPSDPTGLFNNAISPMNNNSLASLVVQCDLNDRGTEKCKDPQNLSMPLGSGAASAKDIMAFVRPASQTPEQSDYGQTVNNNPIQDRPNQVWWMALYTKFAHFWNGVMDTDKNFSGPTKIKISFDNRALEGITGDQASLTNLIPNDNIRRTNLNSTYASSTDSKTTDPGYKDNMTRQLLYKNLTPCSWQSGACQL